MENRIKELRERKKMSQGELADEAGTTQAVISKIELNKQPMTDIQMVQIAGALGEHPAELITDPRWNEIPFAQLNEPILKNITKILLAAVRKNPGLTGDSMTNVMISLYRHYIQQPPGKSQSKKMEEVAAALIAHELGKRG